MFTIFFSGEKLVFLDSLPKGQNIDSYYFCNTVLEVVKVGALAGTRKAALRDFHIHMNNCKLQNFEIDEGKIGRNPAHLMGSFHILTRYCTLELLVFRVEQKRDEGTGLLESRGGQNILTRNGGKDEFRSTFQFI
jgi:hypothetical protein